MMELTSLKEYAARKNLSYESIRRQVARYRNNELKGHIQVEPGTKRQLIDEEGIAFLDGRRQKNPVSVVTDRKHEEAEELKRQLETAKLEIIRLQQEVIELQKQQQTALVDKALSDFKLTTLQKEVDAATAEAARYQRTIFGLYRRI